MHDKLINKYLKYAATDEAFAVAFVKKNIAQAKGHWVDIVDFDQYEMSSDKNFFRDDAPPEVKALANNLYDRTNPLWDRALQYAD